MSRFGTFLLRHRRFQATAHRIAHRLVARDKACLVCTAVWRALEAQPGFTEALDRGLADIEAGRFTRWEDIRGGGVG